ncbi:MAG: hypothetical protein ACTHOF_02075 [Flavisolibacter sp.]
MKVFICVYRHTIKPSYQKQVLEIAKSEPLVNKFVYDYFQQGNVYDWGDDPAFFMANQEFNDPNLATWGVCRPEVRNQLEVGDLVIFFCGKQDVSREWAYYFIGFGTVKQTLTNREDIWQNDLYKRYRGFFNILVKDGQQFEPFGKMHTDWLKRAQSPYVFFEEGEPFTSFNITNPLKVATCIPKESLLEKWYSLSNSKVQQLENVLFNKYFQTNRRLRINNPQRAHVHIRYNLSEKEITLLRSDLLPLVQ